MKTLFQRPDRLKQPLDVLVPVFNSARYRNRWKHYEDFITMAERTSVRLWTVEIAFGGREFAVTRNGNPRHLRLRTSSELWHKERSQNLLLQYALSQQPDIKYIAFVDPDITFIRHDWADETLHALQHYDVVQMWREAYDLDDNGHIIQQHKSFAACYDQKLPYVCNGYYQPGKRMVYWHPGYAWAWRRKALDAVGGLIDWGVLGSADFHMAHSLIGKVQHTLNPRLHPRYAEAMLTWQDRAKDAVRRNIGCVPGAIFHHYHGAKANRKYKERWKILESTQFNPATDLIADSQGLFQFRKGADKRTRKLRDDVRGYFHARNEDK